jgi:hypothetical protein
VAARGQPRFFGEVDAHAAQINVEVIGSAA